MYSLEASIACAVEYEAFTGAQLNQPRKPKEENLPVLAINKNKIEKERQISEKSQVSSQNEIKNLTEIINDCFGKMSKKLEAINIDKNKSCYKCRK